MESSITFSTGDTSQEILVLGHDGVITWNNKGKEIVIEDKKMLCIALMDVVARLSNGIDVSKLDQELYGEYKKLTN